MDSFQWVDSGETSTTLESLIAERYVSANLDAGATKGSIQTPVGGSPRQALTFGSSTSDNLTLDIPASNEVYVSFRSKFVNDASSSSADIIRFVDTNLSTQHAAWTMDDFGTFRMLLRGSSELGRFHPVDWHYGEWNHIEFYLKVDNTTGAYDFRVNGTSVDSDSGIDTQAAGGGADIGRIVLVNPTSASGNGHSITDLIVVNGSGSRNNTFTGENKFVYQLLPTGDTADEDWTQSTGVDSYALIDEISRVTTDYVESSTAAEKTLCSYGSTGSEAGIMAVTLIANAALDTGATTENFKQVVKEGATEGDGATQDVTASATQEGFSDIFETNPDTTAAWTSAELDGVSAGVEYV